MQLIPIEYQELNSKQKEIYNFCGSGLPAAMSAGNRGRRPLPHYLQKVAAKLADYGFNCIKLADDWQGADFLAYHKDGEETLKVQLKGRLLADRKYVGKKPLHGVPAERRLVSGPPRRHRRSFSGQHELPPDCLVARERCLSLRAPESGHPGVA